MKNKDQILKRKQAANLRVCLLRRKAQMYLVRIYQNS